MEHNESKDTPRAADVTPPSEYVYRWNYEEQCAHDARIGKKKRRNGTVVYAIVMTAVFLVCFGLLAGVLVWYRADGVQASGSSAPSGEALSTGDVAELIKPSTVLIYASDTGSYGYGTGFFIGSNGYIATNYHVVQGRTYYSVTLYSGEKLEAEVIGYSEADDLAVLKIPGYGYPVPAIGNSDALRVGDKAIAIGNPSGADAPWSTTQGIVSALNREVTVTGTNTIEALTMIQTDAALNPGNSGGPLCNDRGEVIGIVARKMTDYEGVSFAIPINGAMEILTAIMKTGSADGVESTVSKVRPTVGITGGTIGAEDTYTYGGVEYTAGRDGVLVSTVDANGAAYGKLQIADIIIAMDGKPVTDMDGLIAMLYEYRVGDSVTFTVWRRNQEVEVSLTLGS